MPKIFFQERLDEAGKLYEEAIEIQKTVLGPDHPKLAMLLSNQAFLLLDQVSIFG